MHGAADKLIGLPVNLMSMLLPWRRGLLSGDGGQGRAGAKPVTNCFFGQLFNCQPFETTFHGLGKVKDVFGEGFLGFVISAATGYSAIFSVDQLELKGKGSRIFDRVLVANSFLKT